MDVLSARIAQRRQAHEAARRVAAMAGVSTDAMIALGALHLLRVEPARVHLDALKAAGYIKQQRTALGRLFHSVTEDGRAALMECNSCLRVVIAAR